MAVATRRVREYDKWLPEDMFKEHMAHFPIVAVDIVVFDRRGRFLLVRRNQNNFAWKDTWATPGGRIFRNEPIRRAAQRVLKRETGLNIEPQTFNVLGVEEAITPKQHGVTVILKGRVQDTEVRCDQTSSSARWFTSSDTPRRLRREYKEILLKAGVKARSS